MSNIILSFTYVTVYLTAASLFLSVYVVSAHMLSNYRQRRIAKKRLILQILIQDWLNDKFTEPEIMPKLIKAKSLLLGVVIQLTAQLPPEKRPAIYHLFDTMDMVRPQLKKLRHRRWSERAQAASNLGFMGSPSAIQPLEAALEDPLLDVRLAAAHALARLGATDSVGAIMRHLALPAEWPLQRVSEILTEMGPQVSQTLINYLLKTDCTDAERMVAIRALGMLRAVDGIPVITKHLSHSSDDVRAQSAKALGEMADPATGVALGMALNDSAWEVRAVAARALGNIRPMEAVQQLKIKLADPVWWVRHNAAESLYRFGEPGINALRASLQHSDRFVREISQQLLEEHRAI